MSSQVQPAANANFADDDARRVNTSSLPVKEIPGDYGIPFYSAVRDRLDYYYFQGVEGFFQSRVDKYGGSTVFRVNMPPGPFMASDPRVVCVLDAKSFPVLFDITKVEKKNVFTGTYMSSVSLTGGYRVCSYLDPSEPNHAKIKQLLFNLLASRKSSLIPTFQLAYSALFDAMESQLHDSSSADFNKLNDNFGFEFIGNAYFGSPPSEVFGSEGASMATKWLLPQLAPLITVGLPKIIEEVFLHTFPLPSCIVKSDYKALYSYFDSAAGPDILDHPDKLLGLSRSEACHNLLFATVFNSYGGIKVFFPLIVKWLSTVGPDLHAKLVDEIRTIIKDVGRGGINFAALSKMDLVNSVIYEVLRMDPPVKFQYGKAKKDLIIESHDAAYNVKKGEMIFGYQPFATRDKKVFTRGDEFLADRFIGEKGKSKLKYVVWSNGPETESPTLGNKQCPGKEFVVMIGRLLVVELFMRYDTFTAKVENSPLGTQVMVTSVIKATKV